MKKVITLVAVSALVFTSCGRSGWSCKKRYCDVKEEKIELIKQENVLTENCDIAQL